jgi:DNA recombination-dependent growth factor C
MKPLSIKQILEDLNNGLTRLKKDDFGKGSIQEKYDLTMLEVRELFQHEKLINRVTKRWGNGISFIIIDDVDAEPTEVSQEENQSIVEAETAGEMLLRTQKEVEKFTQED